MKYLNFIIDKKILSELKGSTIERLNQLESELKYGIPLALREYLLVMGEETSLYEYCDEHGTNEILKLREWLYEWVEKYREQGIALNEIKNVLPFFNFQDTFFYLTIEDGDDNPPVYAFDINDRPTIRKLDDQFSEFVRRRYEKKLKEI